MAFLKKISSTQNDTDLVKQYKSGGDINVLGELYSRYMELVYGVCLKYFKEPEESKDAVINIFEELVTKLKKYDVANFKSWLYQLAKNHCLMKIRSSKSKPLVVDVDIMHLEENNHLDYIEEKEKQLNGWKIVLNNFRRNKSTRYNYFISRKNAIKKLRALQEQILAEFAASFKTEEGI